MNKLFDFGQLLEATFVLIVIYLLVRNAGGVSSIIASSSRAYIGAVTALQGR